MNPSLSANSLRCESSEVLRRDLALPDQGFEPENIKKLGSTPAFRGRAQEQCDCDPER